MDLQAYPFVIAGSGLLGAVMAERIANDSNQRVLVVEKRNHIGGNCYSETDPDTQIEYHKYGTHIFHTNNEKVWNYVNQFTRFNSYRHRVLTSYKNKHYPFPINLSTINSFYHKDLKPSELEEFMATVREPLDHEPANFEEKAISLLGRDLYGAFIKGYTLKQWQVDPKRLFASIFDRLPFKKDFDENYFGDRWQGIPVNGYTELFKNLLASKKISVLLNTDFFSIKEHLRKDACLIYSGPIDRFFEYKFGRLKWRTLRFQKETIESGDYQGRAVINFPEQELPYTRIHEPKHLHPERNYPKEKTIIFKEFSLKDDGADPFYPILSDQNIKTYNLYKEQANQLKNVFISGRLGDYKYYDMHQTIGRALEIYETEISPKIQTL
jgi:UDP-galactopyranose mutase